jgi:hypothetical protein
VEPIDVVRSHLAAVSTGDHVAMSADYAPGALLVRPDATYQGHRAIADYFGTVRDRLAGGRVVFDEPALDDGRVMVRWRIEGGPGDGTSGSDRYEVADGMIVYQTVVLDGRDF